MEECLGLDFLGTTTLSNRPSPPPRPMSVVSLTPDTVPSPTERIMAEGSDINLPGFDYVQEEQQSGQICELFSRLVSYLSKAHTAISQWKPNIADDVITMLRRA